MSDWENTVGITTGWEEGKIYHVLLKCDADAWLIFKGGELYVIAWSSVLEKPILMKQKFFDLEQVCVVSESPYTEVEYLEWLIKERGEKKVGMIKE